MAGFARTIGSVRYAASVAAKGAALVTVLALPPLAAGPLPAQTASDGAWHVVRPGEDLETLADRYLGARARWPELWRLNPDIQNPDLIRPGQRVRVALERGTPEAGAVLARASRRVEGQATPIPWRPAREQDVLLRDDGVRTFEASSAELVLSDRSRLMLSERSMVILGRDRSPRAVDRDEIEVVVGQADLQATDAGSGSLEVILGNAVATPRASDGGELSTRLRQPEAGGGQVMVYEGEGVLAAGDEAVTLERGTGSLITDGAPSPPEPLLPAPELAEPTADAERPHLPSHDLRWSPVEGAATYVTEVCRDPDCARLEARLDGLEAPRAALKLEPGTYHWRVTAVAPSGLDGYPSDTRRLRILDLVDETPPSASLTLRGPMAEVDGSGGMATVVGPGTTVEMATDDAESGVAEIVLTLDGRTVDRSALAGGWARGPHELTVVVRDLAGLESRASLDFVHDDEPPTLSWGVEGDAPSERVDGPGPAPLAAEVAQRARAGADPLLWPPDGSRAPGCAPEDFLCHPAWETRSDSAQIVLRPRRGTATVAAVDGTLSSEAGLWVLAEDRLTRRLRSLRFQVDVTDGAERLLVEATDLVGNRGTFAVPLRDE